MAPALPAFLCLFVLAAVVGQTPTVLEFWFLHFCFVCPFLLFRTKTKQKERGEAGGRQPEPGTSPPSLLSPSIPPSLFVTFFYCPTPFPLPHTLPCSHPQPTCALPFVLFMCGGLAAVVLDSLPHMHAWHLGHCGEKSWAWARPSPPPPSLSLSLSLMPSISLYPFLLPMFLKKTWTGLHLRGENSALCSWVLVLLGSGLEWVELDGQTSPTHVCGGLSRELPLASHIPPGLGRPVCSMPQPAFPMPAFYFCHLWLPACHPSLPLSPLSPPLHLWAVAWQLGGHSSDVKMAIL